MEHINRKEKKETHRILLWGGYKKSLRIFFTLGIATTMAFGLTGCGNSEAPVEEAEVVEDVETEEDNTPEVIGEDSTDTLTIDELVEGVGSSDLVEALDGKNQDVLDLMTDWMGQNGYYNIEATLFDEYTPVCNASAILRSDESVMNLIVELRPLTSSSYDGNYSIFVDDANGKRIGAFSGPELPSALGLNALIEEN